jgi:hypothetical protein
VVAALHRHEHRNAEPDLVLVHQRHPAGDDAIGLEPLDPFPARCRRQPDPVADLGDGQRGILLKYPQNLAIDGIDTARGFGKRHSEIRHFRTFF